MTGAGSIAAHAAAAESTAIACAGRVGNALIADAITASAIGARVACASAIAGVAAVHGSRAWATTVSCTAPIGIHRADTAAVSCVGTATVGDVTRARTALLTSLILTRIGLAVL